MRYLIAILCAIAGAALVTMFVSSRVASLIVATQRFDDPDHVANLHAWIFMAVNTLGLLAGWGIGWLIGGRLVEPDEPLA
jgi:hypothetical protein